MVTPLRMCASFEADAQRSTRPRELGPVVDAVEPPVVVEADGAHDPAILAGQRDELGQVQLAGRRGTARGSDPAAEPGGVERVQAGVDLVASSSSAVASLASTIRSTVPNSLRTTRPRRCGSAAKTLARAIAASSGAPRLEDRLDRSRRDRAGHRRTGRGSRSRPAGSGLQGGPDARRRCRAARPGARSRRVRRSVADGGTGRRGDDDRAGRRPSAVAPGVQDEREHRPAAQRVQHLGMAECIRVPRPAARTTATVGGRRVGLGGVTRGRAVRATIGSGSTRPWRSGAGCRLGSHR